MTATDNRPAGAELLDVETFAERVLGRPLWPHQVELARSPARYRVMCAGRQVGKSTLLAVLALHTAATHRNALVLLVSAGEHASRRLLADAAELATGSPLLRGSVLDESRSSLTLANGSRVLSVSASQRQIRGWPVDLLIVDEAGFIDNEIWRAAEPAIIARPGSRVVLSSSPWGGVDHFFRQLWTRGTTHPDQHVTAWHWPSTVSPLVDAVLLDQIRGRESADYFAREYLAEWTDEAGAYFTHDEVMGAVASYAMTDPLTTPHQDRQAWTTVAGLDWGVARDANALVCAGVIDPLTLPDRRARVFVPWLRAAYRMPWAEWISYVTDVTRRWQVPVIASETNGVGAYPTDDLRVRVRRNRTAVTPVWTDVRRKQAGFGMIKTLLQSDRLVLPRDPELIKQLCGLQFEQLAGGSLRIAVPESAGHDDLAMALLQALSCVNTRALDVVPQWQRRYAHDREQTPVVATGNGTEVPTEPRTADGIRFFHHPAGAETGEGW